MGPVPLRQAKCRIIVVSSNISADVRFLVVVCSTCCERCIFCQIYDIVANVVVVDVVIATLSSSVVCGLLFAACVTCGIC